MLPRSITRQGLLDLPVMTNSLLTHDAFRAILEIEPGAAGLIPLRPVFAF